MKVLPIVFFVSLILCVWSGMHLLVYFRLVKLFTFGPRVRLLLKIVLLALALSFVIGRILAEKFHFYLLQEISYIWLGVVSLLFFLVLTAIPVNLLKPRWNVALAWTVLALTLLITVAGLINYGRGHVINRIRLNAPATVSLTRTVKLVQLSDLHIARNSSMNRISRIVDDTLAQAPDLIVITGDILEEEMPLEDGLVHQFSRLKAPLGVYAVSGNHELYTGLRYVESFLKACNIVFLRNERLDIGSELTLLGFDDREFLRLDKNLRNRQLELLHSVDRQRYNILLYHRPEDFAEHVGYGIHLQLSGHTHAGQTIPLNLIVFAGFRYPSGLYRLQDSSIYTSKGTGIWGPPLRFPFRSELTVFSIVPAKN